MIINVGMFVSSQTPITYNDGVNAVTPHKHTKLSLRTLVPIDVDPKNHYGEQHQETQVFGLNGHDGPGMLPDKTDATRTKSRSHLSNSFVFEPDRNNGSYEIPSEPAGPDNAQVEETLVINPRLGVIPKDVEDKVKMFLNWQPGFISTPRRMGMFSMTCTDFRKHETVTTPGTDTETGYGRFLIPNQHLEIGYYEMSTSLIIDLDDTKDVDDNDETLRQPTDLSTYRFQ